MKVLLMGPYPPPHGGVQTNLVAIRRYLLARGIPCSVINLTRFRQQEHDGIYYPKTAWGVLRLLLKLNYNLIHLHAGGDLSFRHAAMLLLCSLLPGKKTVFTFHSGGYPSSDAGRRAGAASLRGFVLRRLDRIIAVNQELVDLFRRFGVPSGRIRLILPYTAESPAGDARLPEFLEKFYQSHQPVLVTVSGLEPEYDLPLQIEALESVRRQYPGTGLVIIGGGSQETYIRHWITAKPYRDDILLCGDLPHETTLCAIREGSVFLRTTLYDGDSISVREALHLGLPVIATNNGMRPAGVHLIPISDSTALCRAILECLENTAARAHCPPPAGAENLEAVLNLYTALVQPSVVGTSQPDVRSYFTAPGQDGSPGHGPRSGASGQPANRG